ncbi:hypothetical protein Hdeb2414_s0024g00650811 [Helianthus debilis subsp. tardiflorus]
MDHDVELRFSVAGAIYRAKNSKEFMEREKPESLLIKGTLRSIKWWKT